jgi:uncharacterized membrane protein
MTTETRLDQVERDLEQMATRVRRLEREAGAGVMGPTRQPPRMAPSRPVPSASAAPAQASTRAASSSARPASGPDFEEIFGGRVLAWIGGLAILLGAVLFMGMAIDRGWLDETTRTVIAMIGAVALLVTGIWLQERKGHADAAQAAVASAISALYAILLVATQSYELIPTGSALIFAALIAGVGFAIAVRWSSPIVAAVGSLGALGAPLLVGIGTSGVAIPFVATALAATVGILIWHRWDWLALGAFAVSAPQLIAWVVANHNDNATLTLVGLVGFWALYAGAAFGYELRVRAEEALPAASWLLLLGSCALVVSAGYYVFDHAGNQSAAVIWVLGFSAVYLLLGGIAVRSGIHREVGSLLIGLGIALSALGIAEALDGPGLVLAWAAESIVLAYLATRLDASPDPMLSSAERLLIVAGAFLALATGHILFFEAPPEAMVGGLDDLGSALAAISACVAAAFAFHRFAGRISPAGARIAAFAGAAALVYLGSVLIIDTIGVNNYGERREAGQVWLSAFWTLTGLGAVIWGLLRRSADVRRGGLALLGLAIVKVWTYDLSALDELARVLSFIGLGLLLLVGAFAYQRIKPGEQGDEREPRVSV